MHSFGAWDACYRIAGIVSSEGLEETGNDEYRSLGYHVVHMKLSWPSVSSAGGENGSPRRVVTCRENEANEQRVATGRERWVFQLDLESWLEGITSNLDG